MPIDPRLGWAGIRELDAKSDPFLDDQLAVWSDAGRRFFTMQEWLVLKYLRKNANKLCSVDNLENWLYSGRHGDWPTRNCIFVYLNRIRKKLNGTGYMIRHVRNAGFMLERE